MIPMKYQPYSWQMRPMKYQPYFSWQMIPMKYQALFADQYQAVVACRLYP